MLGLFCEVVAGLVKDPHVVTRFPTSGVDDILSARKRSFDLLFNLAIVSLAHDSPTIDGLALPPGSIGLTVFTTVASSTKDIRRGLSWRQGSRRGRFG